MRQQVERILDAVGMLNNDQGAESNIVVRNNVYYLRIPKPLADMLDLKRNTRVLIQVVKPDFLVFKVVR